MMNRLIKISGLFAAFSLQSACVVQMPAQPDDPAYAPVLAQSAAPSFSAPGTIFNASLANSLYSDKKARRVGDLITIILNEQTSSTKSSTVTVDKDSSVSINENGDGNTLFGTNPSMGGLSLPTNLAGTREFEGEAGCDGSDRRT